MRCGCRPQPGCQVSSSPCPQHRPNQAAWCQGPRWGGRTWWGGIDAWAASAAVEACLEAAAECRGVAWSGLSSASWLGGPWEGRWGRWNDREWVWRFSVGAPSSGCQGPACAARPAPARCAGCLLDGWTTDASHACDRRSRGKTSVLERGKQKKVGVTLSLGSCAAAGQSSADDGRSGGGRGHAAVLCSHPRWSRAP